jgi:superfamily II DNA or RNA helicase
MILRDYQQRLFDEIRQSINSNQRQPLVVSPTGSGKTATFCYIASKARSANTATLILAHRRELITQTSATLNKFGVPHGIIQPSVTADPSQCIQIGMVQTISRRVGKINAPSLIIVDEAHHSASNTYKAIISAFPNAAVIGFTATPLRLDGKGLGDYFSNIILGQSVEWLMENGFLCRPKYFAPPMQVDLKGIRKRGGDYATDQLADAMTSRVITGDAVKHYQKLCPDARAVVFCCNINHATHVMGEFNDAGISAGIIHGSLSNDQRKQVVDNLTTGKIKIMVSVDVISEGFDLPSVETAILLRPTTSLGLYLQQIGRILRPAPNKTAFILDHVGNISKHGLAEDHREWSLDGIDKKFSKSEVSTHKQCEGCFCMFIKTLPACPECGYEKPPAAPKIVQIDGELVEITSIRSLPYSEAIAKCKTRDDLKKIAQARGYKAGWVYHQAKELNLR